MKIENLIQRVFTKELENQTGKTVYDLFTWKTVDVLMKDHKSGKILTNMKNLEFPEFYSQNACDIIASKYFKRAGVPNAVGYERSMKEVVHRMVGFWMMSALDSGILTEENAKIFYDEVAYLILDQRMAPNSPQWFNTGLKFAYEIEKSAEGHFYFDPSEGKVVPSKDAYTRTQGSACFIVSIKDSLLGKHSITELLETETRLFKHGSGTGSNFSKIRGKGEKLSGGGTSSGLLSFLKVLDVNAGSIKSGGVTRRAAKINSLNIDHPDTLDFISWKVREEEKAIALGKMGYGTDFNDESYETVSGQNANNSIRIPNVFMHKIIGKDEPSWELKGRVDSLVNKIVDADYLWGELNYASWRVADPAVQYHNIINDWLTTPVMEDGSLEEIEGSNPCSEFHHVNDTACNLLSHNMIKYYNPETGEFMVDDYMHAVFLSQIVLEATIHWGQFPTEEIAKRSYLLRPTGQGIANTGALHMMMGHPYDSDEARAVASAITGILTGQAFYASAMIAKKIGPFALYESNKGHMLRVIKNHAIVAGSMNEPLTLRYEPVRVNHDVLSKIDKDLSCALKLSWSNALHMGELYGYRNSQTTVIAPTGTIALAMDCASTSVEPFFSHVTYKKLAGGGAMELVNPYIPAALRKLGYDEEQIEAITEYVLRKDENGHIIDGKIEGAPYLKEEHLPVFDTANNCGTGTRVIKPMAHVNYVAALTPLLSGAISKTVNLPNTATVEEFKEVHLKSWELGVKCISLYRDGSKASQPLNSSKAIKEEKFDNLSYAVLLDLAKKLKEENTLLRKGETSTVLTTQYTEEEDTHKIVTCGSCGSSARIPNVTCFLCMDCGSTTGCS